MLTANCGQGRARLGDQSTPAAKAHCLELEAVSRLGRSWDLDAVVVGLLAVSSIPAAGCR